MGTCSSQHLVSSNFHLISPTEDGLRLFDPYNRPVLHVRRPGNDDVEEYVFLNDDPFLTEISEFVDVIEHGKPVENLLSTFEGTYGSAGSLFRLVMTPTLHLPPVRCVQDVRTHVRDSKGWRRDPCKTHVEVGLRAGKLVSARPFGIYLDLFARCGYALYNLIQAVVQR